MGYFLGEGVPFWYTNPQYKGVGYPEWYTIRDYMGFLIGMYFNY